MQVDDPDYVISLPPVNDIVNLIKFSERTLKETQEVLNGLNEDRAPRLLIRLEDQENCFRDLHLISSYVRPSLPQDIQAKFELLREQLLLHKTKLEQKLTELNRVSYRPNLQYGPMGRPKFEICRDQLLYLRERGFKWGKIAELLGVSWDTVRRRRRDLNIGDDIDHLTEEQVDQLVADIKEELPESAGTTIVMGHIIARGYNIANLRLKVWKSLAKQDPVGTSLRWCKLIKRRQYSVRSPGSLWHMDGHHKMIRWGFIIHGAIDGFSRLIVMLGLSTNNTAERVKELFQEACNNYFWPSHLRTDRGGENVEAGHLIEEKHGENRGSWLQGKSTHNQRIERLWRDGQAGCWSFHIDLFRSFERNGVLDPDNAVDLFSLHYVFIPRIQLALDSFREAWNKHPMRTQGNRSPEKVYIEGMLARFGSGYREVEAVFDEGAVDQSYGVDHEAGTLEVTDTEAEPRGDLLEHLDDQVVQLIKARLREEVTPLTRSPDNGKQLYLKTKNIVRNIIANAELEN